MKTPKEPFVNAQMMAKMNPETFDAPNLDKLKDDLCKGFIAYVKVCVGDERFWTIVKNYEGGIIEGEVNNDLMFIETHGLSCGDIIKFHPENVYDTWEI